MLARRTALVGAALSASACWFNGAPPDDAVLLCTADAECPVEWSCDLAVHECVAPGATPDRSAPALLAAAFSPAVVATGLVELTLTADEALGEAPVLHFEGSGDPGFVPLDVVGAVARLSLDATTVAAGAWPLGSIELADLQGNRATRLTPDLALVVDRRAPNILDVAVAHADAAAEGLPFSPNAGTNQLVASFVVDETVASEDVEVQAGPEAATCTAGAGNSFSCLATVSGAFTDGSDRVAVSVRDRAGNRAEATVNISTDLRAPTPIDVVTVLRSPSSSAPVGAAVAGGSVELELILDEPLGVPPLVTLTGDAAFGAAQLEQLTPLRWRWQAEVETVGAPGAALVSATLEDVVGNAGTLQIASVPLAQAVLSPCAPLDPSAACVDVDGDGDFPVTVACGPSGGDCDDTDPLVRSDGAEIPGDGADNDCAGDGDAPIDESSGVFVDAAAALPGTGTRAAPARTIDEALPLLAGRTWLFLAHAGGASYGMTDDLRVSLLGGLDASWQRVPDARSSVQLGAIAPPATGAAVVVLDSIQVAPGTVNVGVWLIAARTRVPYGNTIVTWNRITAVDASVSHLEIHADVTGSLLSRTTIDDQIVVGGGSSLLIHGADSDDLTDGNVGPDLVVGTGASLDVISSRVPTIGCDGCRLRVIHSIIGTGEPSTTALIDVTNSPWPVELRNNILTWTDGGPGDTCVRNDNGKLRALGNLFHAPFAGALLVADSTFSASNVEVINSCEPPDCADGDGNIAGDPRFSALSGHIELASPAMGAGVAAYEGLPASVALDIDGECRGASEPEIGADER